MLRIALALLAWLALVGGLELYLAAKQPPTLAALPPPASRPGLEAPTPGATGEAVLELTPGSRLEPDPFALELPGPALLVRLGGRELLALREPLPAGRVLRLPLPPGEQELFLRASPAPDESDRAHSLRVRVLRGDELLADQTLWAGPGEPLAGTVPLPAGEGRHGR